MKHISARALFLLVTFIPFCFADTTDGEKVYNKSCAACHSAAVAPALKSPQVHDTKAWALRFAQAEAAIKTDKTHNTALDYLVSRVKAGVGAMPPGGTCVDCKDQDYKAAIEFMSKE